MKNVESIFDLYDEMGSSPGIINMDEKIIKGLSVSKGIVEGRICLFNDNRHAEVFSYTIAMRDVDGEKKRFTMAVAKVIESLDGIIKNVELNIGEPESRIFLAQKMIAMDGALREEVFAIVDRRLINVESALSLVLESYEKKMLDIEDKYLQSRVTDFREIRKRFFDAFFDTEAGLYCEGQKHCLKGDNRIVVSRELTPEMITSLDTTRIRAFVTEHGGKSSHAAILARARGIPAVSGVRDVLSLISCGMDIIVNGDEGLVILNPSVDRLSEYKKRINKRDGIDDIPDPVAGIKIMANINTYSDVLEAQRVKAEGVGLYRTEFEFLSAGRILTEDEQYEIFRKVIDGLEGKPVYFRLLDIGGDKGADFFDLPEEENPSLGFRGSRFLLEREKLLRDHVRAIARGSLISPVHIIYPMIIDSDQYMKLKTRVLEYIEDISGSSIRHGVMFEVPSACLDAEKIMELADFASIGTNDLIQYLFAVDRNNEKVAYDYNPDRRIFWDLITDLSEIAKEKECPLSVCGEIAGDPVYAPKLGGLGIKILSVSPILIPELRRSFQKIHRQNQR